MAEREVENISSCCTTRKRSWVLRVINDFLDGLVPSDVVRFLEGRKMRGVARVQHVAVHPTIYFRTCERVLVEGT